MKWIKTICISLMLMFLAAVSIVAIPPRPVQAADIIEIVAPSDITLSSLYGTSGDATGSSTTAGTVLCTYANGYTLEIESDDAAGKMEEAGAAHLAAALKVTADLTTGTGATTTQVVGDDQVITTTKVEVGNTSEPAPEEDGVNNITLSAAQPKQTTGPAGDYSLTLTFTAEPN